MKKLLIAAVVAATLTGCNSTSKGKQEFDTANQLAAANKYQEAIAYLAQAVQKNPKNEQYKAALASLKQKFEAESVAKINGLLGGDITNDNLMQAADIVANLEGNATSTELTAPLLAKVSAAKESLYAELASQYESAKSAYAAGDLVKSYATFKAIDSKFTNYEDVALRLKSITKEVNQSYLKKANAAIKADDFATAGQLLNDILKINPNNNIAKGMLAKVNKSNSPAFFLAKAQKQAGMQDWAGALVSCDKALSLDSANSACLLLKSQAKSSLNVNSEKAFLETMKEGRLVEAKGHLSTIIDNRITDAALIEEYSNAFTQKSDYVASLYVDKGQYAMAWNLLTSIQDIQPSYPELFNKIREVEDAISKRAKRSIAVFDFNSPSESDDAGVIVANNLISRLFNNASNDITILERENLKSILEEMKLGQIGVVSESTAKEMGRVYGIDYAIMGSVLLYKVDENSSQSTKTIRYQTGEKISDNIDYLNWIAANPKPSKSDLKSAPQAKILTPEYGQTEYEVTNTKKVGFLQLSFRIVDVLTGENTRVDTIERKLQVEDSANAGVSEAGVEFDAMEIPTDTEILQQLTEQVVESMASDVLRPLQQLETFYFNQGQDSEKRSEIENAIEYYTYAIFNEKLKSVSSSPISREANTRIDNLLSTHKFMQ
ncbi:MAG: CsgG/HfaB family protein [Glaciecola sp.]